ncbi:winged helix-turn-helix domain-containing protein [Viridibacillus sp. FSL R5-0477]|nr:winged helix-turn-helix domain-containing protein [Viridibacillus arenosi]
MRASIYTRPFTRLDYEGTERTVDMHIRKIRKRLESLAIPIEIKTLRNIGYRLGERHE